MTIMVDPQNEAAAAAAAATNTASAASLQESPSGGGAVVSWANGHATPSDANGTTEEDPAASEGAGAGQGEEQPSLHRKPSISEAADAASGGWNAHWALKWFEFPFAVKDSKDGRKLQEATGWAMDSAARGPLNQLGTYVGSAILRMATKEAGGCANCPVRGGLKTSSLLTATSAIVGVVAAILMPFVGAIVDHTEHRKMLGVLSGILVVGMTGIQIGISLEKNNWFFMLVIDAIQSFALLVHTTSVFAYLPDLTTDEEVLSHYTSQFHVRQFSAQFVYSSLLIIVLEVRDPGRTVKASVQTAKIAAAMTFAFAGILIFYAWTFLFRKRPALSQVPEGQSLLTTGFVQVKNTSAKIWKDYKALKWFMLSLLWSPEAGAGVVLSIAVSFLTVDIGFSGTDFVRLALLILVTTVVGALFSKWVVKMINPLNAYRGGLLGLGFSIAISSALLHGPEDRRLAIGMSALWGISLGWCYPAQRVLFCTLIPKGQETEMMGLFTFTGQILGWLPPLIVTIMNENGVSLRYGLLVVTGFCVMAMLTTLLMGSYRDATEKVALDSEAKLESVMAVTMASADPVRIKDNTKNNNGSGTTDVPESCELALESSADDAQP